MVIKMLIMEGAERERSHTDVRVFIFIQAKPTIKF